ncbi:MAG: DUF1385 domain-containing protein, partial [Clostridia bacterium]|nr:DUF1385 domain-containing protein [Clostridia bacterium]
MGRAGALLILPSEARMAEPVVLYGGQAVVEGVMMRGPRRVAVAVRTADGDIALRVRESRPWTARYRLLRLPVVRGAATIVESLVLGLDALWYAAVKAGDAEEEDVGHGPLLAMAAVAAIAAAAFFALLPTWVAGWLEPLTGSAWLLNLGEGGVRIGLLVGYLAVLSRLPDMRRVYRYHGAEHKAVAALEAGCPLVVEAVRPFPIRH